jgi:hypothetical protein
MNLRVRKKMSKIYLKTLMSASLDSMILNLQMEKNNVTYLYPSLNIKALKGLKTFSRSKTKFFGNFIDKKSFNQNELNLRDTKIETYLKLTYPLDALNVKSGEHLVGQSQSSLSVLTLLKPYFFKKQHIKSYNLTLKSLALRFLVASSFRK